MDNQKAAQLYLDIQNGVNVPKKTRQMLIGFLLALKARHRHTGKKQEKLKVEAIIKEIKNIDKQKPQENKLI